MKGNWTGGFFASWGVILILIGMHVRLHSDARVALVWGGLWVACTYAISTYQITRRQKGSDND